MTCLPLAAAAFSSTEVVAPSCPRAELVPPPAPCAEAPPAGTLDPATLRCGVGADDIAVALEGASPSATWMTRQSLVIQSGDHGFDWHTLFAGLTPLIPVRTTGSVVTSNCASLPPGTGGAGGGNGGPIFGNGSGGAGGWGGGDSSQQGSVNGLSSGGNVDLSGVADALDSSSSGCDGESGDSGSCGGVSGGDCSGDSGGGDCSGGGDIGDIGAIDCSMHGRRAPRLSPLLLLAMASLAPPAEAGDGTAEPAGGVSARRRSCPRRCRSSAGSLGNRTSRRPGSTRCSPG